MTVYDSNDSCNITSLDIEVLRILNGEDVPGWSWGAAMTMCCEFLVGIGYAKYGYYITDKGKEFLKRNGYDT